MSNSKQINDIIRVLEITYSRGESQALAKAIEALIDVKIAAALHPDARKLGPN